MRAAINDWLTPTELAVMAGVTRVRICQLCRRGKIPARVEAQSGTLRWYIARSDAEAWLRACQSRREAAVQARLDAQAYQRQQPVKELLLQILGAHGLGRLVGEWGGARIWVPVAPSSKLIQTLGEAATKQLCDYFGGDYLQVPKTVTDGTIQQRIARLHRDGRTINDIALAVGRSRRTIFRILRMPLTELRV